jgi:hypothetical protein
MNDRLQSTLKQLRLSGLAETLDVRLQEAAGHQLSHAEFLELILQDELHVRERRQIDRRVKSASFKELSFAGGSCGRSWCGFPRDAGSGRGSPSRWEHPRLTCPTFTFAGGQPLSIRLSPN